MECWFVHKKTPATSFFLITGAKIWDVYLSYLIRI
jgi:hypothetical protein